MSDHPHKLRRWLAGTFIGLLLLVAIGFAALRIALARVPEYQARLQTLVKERTGLLIEFDKLDTKLRVYGPEVVFYRARLRTSDGRVLASARRGAVSLALGRSLINRKLTLGRLSLEGPEIGIVRTATGEFRIIGYQPLDETTEAFELARIPEGHVRIRDARLRFLDEKSEREPWVLSKVELELERTGDRLLVDGSSALPPELGEGLRFNIDVTGDLNQAEKLSTRIDFDGDALQLQRWQKVVAADRIRDLNGVASLDVTTRWSGKSLASLNATIDGREIDIGLPEWSEPIPAADPLVIKRDVAANPVAQSVEPPAVEAQTPAPTSVKKLPGRVKYQRLAAKVDLRHARDDWRLEVTDLNLQHAQVNISSARARAQWTRTQERFERLEAQAEVIPLDAVWPLLAWLPERPGTARVRALEGRGTLTDVRMNYRAGKDGTAPAYHFEAKATDVGFAPVLRTPGLARLDFTITGDERGGTLRLARTPAEFRWPHVFRDTLQFDTLNGDVQWTHVTDAWEVVTDRLDLTNAHGRVQARMKLSLPKDGTSPRIELHADASDLDATAAPRYLPAGRLGEKSLQWLDRAFVTGRVPQATLVLTGELRRFPFRDGGGEFVAKGDLQDLTVDYQPKWLPATNINGTVEFRNEGMRGEMQSARIGGLDIERASATFEDFKETVLAIEAHGRGDLFHALRYVQTSPLGESMGRAFQGLTGRGASRFDVNLTLPLKNLPARDVHVMASLDNAWVDHDWLNAPVSRVRGDLTIQNTQLRAANVRGQWLGGPVDVLVSPQGPISVLQASGQARAPEIARILRLPSTVRLTGSSRWQGHARLVSGAQRSPVASIQLDLDGTSVGMPVPLAKTGDDKRPLLAELELQERAALIRATFGAVRGLARLQQNDEGWTFDRAGLRADGKSPSLPGHAGVRIEGRLERFVLDDWLALAPPAIETPAPSTAKRTHVSDWLRAANVEVGEFGYLGYRWRDLRGVMQAQDDRWLIDVNSAQASGRVQVPYELLGDEPLTLELDRLVMPEREPGAGQTETEERSDPRKFPSLKAKVGDFAVGSHRIGELTISLARAPAGLRIETAEVRSPTFEGRTTGSWLMTPAGELTSIDVFVLSSDVRETLNRLNYRPFMQAKRAEIKGKLAWPGGLSTRWLAQASGQLTVAADEGTLLSLEPGAGRVLGLFSFSALPRRLSLDFSDLTQEGLSFDTIRGDFELRDGNAYTSNLVVSGPATEIGLAGRTGLSARDYDQTVVVTGKLGASLPVAGALAGGPAVAAAVLLFSQIFKEPLKGITRGYYRITGTWDNPVVERVHGAQAREAAASAGETAGAGATGD